MINLFISSDETEWENTPGFMPKMRCLTEYILPEYKNKYLPLSETTIAQLKQMPCIFAYEQGCGCDAHIGFIKNISVRQNDVMIDFELTGETISHEVFSGLSQLLDMGAWEMNRTHWTIKNINIEDIQPYYSEIAATPVVFVSYSWTPMRNQETVFGLVSRLRQDGIRVIYDKEDLYPGQNINYFMEQALERNDVDNIIVVCNKDYAEKAYNRQGGVGYEAGIIISEIKSAPLQRRVIPVAVEMDVNGNPYLPTKFKELYYIDLTRENGYNELIDAIKKYKEEQNHA